MSERRFHETNSGRDAKQSFWFFEGANALWFLAGFGLGMLILQWLLGGDMPWPAALGIASMPVVAACLYVLILKAGKPKSYDLEMFEWLGWRFLAWGNFQGWWRARPYFGANKIERWDHPLAADGGEEDDATR
jgi:hypothetical protein